MADQQTHIHDLLGRRRGWTPIAVQVTKSESFCAQLSELAEARRWRLISLSKYEGHVPPGLLVRGALVDMLPTDATLVELLERGVPAVRLGLLPHPDDHRVPAVMPDRPAAGRLAADHFAERDFKHVACVGRDPWGVNQTLFEGFAARADELGIACHLKQLANKDLSEQKRHRPAHEHWLVEREMIQPWLADLPKPVGLLCVGEVVADRYCQWALELGLGIPQDLAVLTVGNDPFICGSATVPLSSVAFDDAGVLTAAMDMLDKLMAGQALDPTTVMVRPRGVVARQSTDVLAATDPIVVEALRFMWDHLTEDLSVDRIAGHVGFSRRKLERAFRHDLGRGINEELQRRRLERACGLLVHTDLKIADIAGALGFGSRSYFFQVFRKAHGISPAQYRRQQQPSAT